MKIISVKAMLTLLFSLLATPAHATDQLATASNLSKIEIFVDATARAGLRNTLQGKGPFTVFAPSNSAFDKLPMNQRLRHIPSNLALPSKTLDEIKRHK